MFNNKVHKTIDDRLLYRRQFFLGPKFIKNHIGWNTTKLNSDYFITSHPDLDLTICNVNGTQLVLLGFILDSENPNYTNQDILGDLLSKSQNFDNILRNIDKYSGRFILVYEYKNNIKLFTDACGSRSVFYHFGEKQTWCASQPHTIADLLNIEKRDDKGFLEFINSKEFDKHERTMFGDDTLFRNIYHLLPNYYLSVKNKSVKRYWPNKAMVNKTVDQVIKEIAPIINGLYESANNRFKLIQPVTSGRDSRLLLAASKNIRNDIYYFIQKFKGLSRFSRDIRIPTKLLKYLNLDFHIEKCKKYNKEFDKYLRSNVFMLQSKHKKILHYNFFQKFQGYLNVSGNYTGIYRPFPWYVNAPSSYPLVRKTMGNDFRKFKYIVNYVNRWETSFNSEIAKYNYPIIELFYWENKAANWVSMFVNELDIAIEEWCPMNNRKILEAILSIDSKIRLKEKFQIKIVEYLWSETLHEELLPDGIINPSKFSIKRTIYKSLKYTGLFPIAKKIYNQNKII